MFRLWGWFFPGSFRDTKDGVELYRQTGWENYLPERTHLIPLRLGDVITHIEGHPIPNLKILNELTQKPGIGVPFVIAGDPIRVGVQRAGRTLELQFPLPSDASTLPYESVRRSAFPSVFDTDIRLRPDECGGPLIDVYGHVVGITIACWGGDRVYAISASIAQRWPTT